MSFNYHTNDNIYDIESLNNLFIDTHYLPAKQELHCYYLIDYTEFKDVNDHLGNETEFDDIQVNQKQTIGDIVREQILKANHALKQLANQNNLKIKFFNLRKYQNLQQYIEFWGATPNYTSSFNYVKDDGSIHAYFEDDRTFGDRNYKTLPRHQFDKGLNEEWQNSYNYTKQHPNQKGSVMNNHYFTTRNYNLPFRYYAIKDTDKQALNIKDHLGMFLGYNSQNYDMTMIAHLFGSVIKNEFGYHILCTPQKFLDNLQVMNPNHYQIDMDDNQRELEFQKLCDILTPQYMRMFNDQLFGKFYQKMPNGLLDQNGFSYFDKIKTPQYLVYKGWLQANRYFDVSKLNEHMQKVSLKRLSGMMGLQIMESDKLSTDTDTLTSIDELAGLIAYNISDILNTKTLFEMKLYQDALSLRRGLLDTFKGLTYDFNRFEKDKDEAENEDAEEKPDNLRFKRIIADDTSAKYIANVISPYHKLHDWPGISYEYPDPRIIEMMKKQDPDNPNIPDKPFDVLDNTMEWINKQEAKYNLHGELKKAFQPIYESYKQLEHRNVNVDLRKMVNKDPSLKFTDIMGNTKPLDDDINTANVLSKYNMNVFYIDANGNRTSGIANFSIGGIHGAEIKLKKYEDDFAEYEKANNLQSRVQTMFGGNPQAVKDTKKFMIDNVEYDWKQFVKSGKNVDFKDIKKPKVFTKGKNDKNYKVSDKYAFVSSAPAHHEDISSFYPFLLSTLGVFWQHNGKTDKYRQLYEERLALKDQLKNYKKNSPEWNDINQRQLLRKLLLNAASGAADATYANNIRKNNAIVSMRIIGQLFAWRIGQAEALAGARVPSTNTDGLYTMGIDKDTNKSVLESTVQPLLINVGPEELDRFVSKDSNNRLEVENEDGKSVLTEAKGSGLTSWGGPSVGNSLNHPAILDNVLAKYLAYQDIDCVDNEFNREIGLKLLTEMKNQIKSDDTNVAIKAIQYFQWVLVSNPGKHRYPFIQTQHFDTNNEEYINDDTKLLPHTSRIFLIKTYADQTLNTIHLAVRAKLNQKNISAKQKEYSKLQQKFNAQNEQIRNAPSEVQEIALFDMPDENEPKSDTQNEQPLDVLPDYKEFLLSADPIGADILARNGYQLQDYDTQKANLKQTHTQADINPKIYRFMKRFNVDTSDFSRKKEKDDNGIYTSSVQKVTDLDEHQNTIIDNRDLNTLSKKERQNLADKLDLNAYLDIIVKKFNKSWRN